MTDQVVSHYRILEKLGAGGMGVVYKAQDLRLGRFVAIKVLPDDRSLDSAAVQRFQIEARAASALNHPHICTIHEIDEYEGKHFIVMELLEGQTLKDRIGGKPLETSLILEFAIQIADALEAAHAKNIVHRDLKPTNIHVTVSGQAKLLDFGLAKLARQQPAVDVSSAPTATQPLTGEHTILGTMPYMSPEQVLGREVDHHTDLFSLGAVLYEMSTGRLPFVGANAAEMIVQITHEEPPEIAPLNPRLPAGLERIIGKCLEKDRERRYPSAGVLLADLRKLQAGRVPLPRRRLLQAGAFGVAVAGLLALWALLPERWRGGPSGSASPRITRLAVLPLANLSGETDQEYFADGMTEELTTDLAQIGALTVISRTSVMQFKGTKMPLPEIASRLRVDAVVEGSVLRSGGRVRITARLVDGSTGRQQWAKSYERELNDVLTLQGEVARAIAGEIRARMTPQEAGRLSRSRTVNPAALEAYLLGRHYWDQYTEESLLKAIEYFEQAIKLYPGYAAAYAGVAEAWAGLDFIGARPWEEVGPKMREAATRALAIDDTLAEAHTAMAMVYYHLWNWKGAEDEDKRAIGLNPGYSTAHVQYSNMLRQLGRAEESIAEAKRALEIDPLDKLTNQMLGNAYSSARVYDLAIAQYRKALDLHPNDSTLQYLLGLAYVHNRMYDQGIEAIQKSLALDRLDPRLSPDLAYIDALIGKKDETRRILTRLLALVAQGVPVNPGYIALVYIALGERETALTWLEKAYQQHSPMMLWLKVDPRLDSIRQEPKLQELMRRVGLQ